jgi:hypothetical protein
MTVGCRAFCAVMRVPAVMSLLLALALVPSSGIAQVTVTLTGVGGTITFHAPTAADYAAGSLEATTTMPFQIATSTEGTGPHKTSLHIRSSSSTLGNSKPVGHLEWRRADHSEWHAFTTSDAEVESWEAQGHPAGHTFSNTIHFRILLHWTNAHPFMYTGHLVLTAASAKP